MNQFSPLTWFYCLDYSTILLLVFFGSFIWTGLVPTVISRTVFRRFNLFLILIWIAMVLYMTLYNRDRVIYPVELIPFHSYREAATTGNVELYRSNLMNMVLFYPIGLFLLCASGRIQKAAILSVLIGLSLSIFIEWCQYRFMLGRPEIDDILHNTLGALFGATVPPVTFRLLGKGSL